jgi:acetyltransferase-like isoleucine patch superfamily enzyme
MISRMTGPRRRRLLNPIRRRVPFVELDPLLPPGVTIGRHTYGPHDFDATFPMFTEGARIDVGAFCSISPGVRVLGGGDHVVDRASTYPLNARLFDPAKRTSLDSIDRGPTVIGNDVYVGVGAIILSGVRIGDGAVIGAGAVVREPVPPYAIVTGNPGEVTRYRFEQVAIDRLLAVKWWEWSDDEIEELLPFFMGNIDAFLEEAERRHGVSA